MNKIIIFLIEEEKGNGSKCLLVSDHWVDEEGSNGLVCLEDNVPENT